jgi:hypothetical protein
VESALELLKLRVQYPEQFLPSNPGIFKSGLYFTGLKEFGLTGMAETAVSLHLLEIIHDTGGKPASLIQIANILEQAFNFSFWRYTI